MSAIRIIDEHADWLARLQPGDEAALSQGIGYGGSPHGYEIVKIERLTGTQFVASNGRRYRRVSGQCVDRYSIGRIEQVTQEVRDTNERVRLRAWIEELYETRLTLSLDMLRALKAAHDAALPEVTPPA